jgi:peptide deformylase
MSSVNYQTRGLNIRNRQRSAEWTPFNDLALEYDAWFDKDGSLIFFIEAQAFRQLLPSLPKPWLEIGVGSGRFAQALGIETGIDPSAGLVKMARKRGTNAFVSRGEERLFDEESFGTVFLIVTLCFLDSPLKVLKEANRILMPDGKIVLGLVLKESPWGQFYQQKKMEGHRYYKYATFYSYDEVVRLLTRAGFLTEKIVSTLFQRPGEVHRVEEPKEGYFPDAGFAIIVASKPPEMISKRTGNGMGVPSICRFPYDQVLRQKAKRISRIDGSVQRLIDNMIDTMHQANGVGLAAPQVGISLRVIVVQMPEEEPITLINPEIVKCSGEQEVTEGCLSIPGYYGEIKRSAEVTVKGKDRRGKEIRLKASGLMAEALEHEIDHLNGILYTDHINSPEKLHKIQPQMSKNEMRG